MKFFLTFVFIGIGVLFIDAQKDSTTIPDQHKGYIEIIHNPKISLERVVDEIKIEKKDTLIIVDKKPFTPYDVCAKFPKLKGFKIQVSSSKSKDAIGVVVNQFHKEFPLFHYKVEFLRPDYNLKAGEYLTRSAAEKEISAIKKKFPLAIIVIDEVFCKRAKMF